MKKLIPQSIKNIYHLFQAVLANVRYGFPSRKLKVIGVTGTNGKTTTVQMIAKILEEVNFKVAVSSTINFKIAKKEWVNKSKFTTLSSWALQKFLKQAVSAGCEYAVIEVSSHSLDQNRVWGTDFDVAVIANVTREHLDYHQTLDAYLAAKLILFERLVTPGGAAVVAADSEHAGVVAAAAAARGLSVFTVGRAGANLKLVDSEIDGFLITKDITRGGRATTLPRPEGPRGGRAGIRSPAS